jgi:6-phosphogluconolactonase
MYTSNETGNSVTSYQIDVKTGSLKTFQTLSTLPVNYTAANKPADIHRTADNRFLYVSNRGHESIAAFAINPADGSLKPIGHYKTTASPRAFDLDPSGSFLYSAGETNGDLACYRINKNTGALDSITTLYVGKIPSWVVLINFKT